VSPRAKAKAVCIGPSVWNPLLHENCRAPPQSGRPSLGMSFGTCLFCSKVWGCRTTSLPTSSCSVVSFQKTSGRRIPRAFCRRRNVLDFHIRNLNKGSRPPERRFLLVLLVRDRHSGGIELPKWTRSDRKGIISVQLVSPTCDMLPSSFLLGRSLSGFLRTRSPSPTSSYPQQTALIGLGGLGLSTFPLHALLAMEVILRAA
jgi:hypothetical protein